MILRVKWVLEFARGSRKSHSGELVWDKAIDLSQDRLQNKIFSYLSTKFKPLHSATDGQSVYLALQLHLVRFDNYISIATRPSLCREDGPCLSI
jgi:hypothetical protein